jgi:hypothetical protein
MSEFGSFQVLISSSVNEFASTGSGQTDAYKLDLAGNYRLTLTGFQVHSFPSPTGANVTPIEIYSPNFLYPYGNVNYPTFLFPIIPNEKYASNFGLKYHASLQSDIRIQIRDAITKQPLPDLKFAVLNFDYERI